MTFRQKLKSVMASWLLFVNPDNGYTNRIREVKDGFVPIAQNNNDMSAWFIISDDKPIEPAEDGTSIIRECTLFFGIFYKTDKFELSAKHESILSDIFKWLYDGSGITAGKTFFADSIQVNELQYYQGSIDNGFFPAFNYDGNFGETQAEIKVRYQLV